MPNGQRIWTNGSQEGPRETVTTDHELQEGPPPHKIMRSLFANNEGMVTDDANFWPPNGEFQRIPNKATIGQRNRVMTNPSPVGSADTLLVPTFNVGDPIG